MRVNRKTLYLGVLLVVAASVMLAGQAGWLDHAIVEQALGLWPLVVIAIGAALVLRGTRVSLASGMLAAAMPGLLLGGIAVAAPRVDLNCGRDQPASFSTRDGIFDSRAAVNLDLSCGRLTVGTGPGSSWHARTGDGTRSTQSIGSSGRHLVLSSGNQNFRFGQPWAAEDWEITLPTDVLIDLSAQLNAGKGDLYLSGAKLGAVSLDVNAGDLHIDLAGATLESLSLETNAGAATVQLPAGRDFSAAFTANAGKISICAPDDLGVRIHEEGAFLGMSFPGFIRVGPAWETPNYSIATSHANVTVSANVGSVDVNPEGDCK